MSEFLKHCEIVVPWNIPKCLPLPAAAPMPPTRQPIVSKDEPLMDISGVEVANFYAIKEILPNHQIKIRSGVLERLQKANTLLPDEFELVILDGYRTIEEQQMLLDHYGLAAGEAGDIAQITDTGPRPPHTTGGAVDLSLIYRDIEIGLGTDFDDFEWDTSSHLFENDMRWHRSNTNRILRRMMAQALTGVGMVCYEREWWHWSYGDDVWAAHVGCPAVYDIIE